MSDKPLPWPKNARYARNDTAEAALAIIRALMPLVCGERKFSETERLYRESQALKAAHRIVFLMKEQGAPVRPEALE